MPAHSSEGLRLRILVVEDDAEALALTLELLEILGHWAAGVRSAEAALARFLEGAFDVLLIDVGLPALSGCQLAERLRANVRIPIVFATGREEPKRIMSDTIWLRKPYSVAQLENALAQAAKLAARLDPPLGRPPAL
jgi:CheY-like chemotaxis protein